ncbi:toll/interleukin-1 receptor domain-containing protein [Glacieibacterium sp.]|uniref:toll/interleukin-1 receptor domain-containing protein n=1 Tax=Glacieibacterium sp. TaxID=2860237 RepID=UPI003B00792C
MKVFVSWSGELSQKIAIELFDWLPMVLQSVQPYMSSESIDKGTRWASSIANELEGTSVGLIVLTPQNKAAPWINFEAGALAKIVGEARLAPIIFGLKPSEIESPLSQFQVTQFDKDDVLRLLKSINSCALEEALPEARLERMHDALWGQIESRIQPLLLDVIPRAASPLISNVLNDGVSEAIEEILTLVRQQAQFIMNPDRHIKADIVHQIIDSNGVGLDSKSTQEIQDLTSRAFAQWQRVSPSLLVSQDPKDDPEHSIIRDQVKTLGSLIRRSYEVANDHHPGGLMRPGSSLSRSASSDWLNKIGIINSKDV